MKSFALKILLFLALIGIWGSPLPVLSQSSEKASQTKNLKQGGPIQIEARTLTVIRAKNEVIFEGDVVLKRGETTIHCDRLVAYYSEKERDVRKAICRGNVKVIHRDTTATCEQATFDNPKQIITLEGSPVIYQGEQIIRGRILKYYLKDDRISGKDVHFFRRASKPSPKKTP